MIDYLDIKLLGEILMSMERKTNAWPAQGVRRYGGQMDGVSALPTYQPLAWLSRLLGVFNEKRQLKARAQHEQITLPIMREESLQEAISEQQEEFPKTRSVQIDQL